MWFWQLYKSSQPRNPTSDFIRPDSLASISLSVQEESLLGPFSPNSSVSVLSDGMTPVSQELSDGEVTAMLQDSDLQTLPYGPPLDLSWDLLCDRDIFRVCLGALVQALDTVARPGQVSSLVRLYC